MKKIIALIFILPIFVGIAYAAIDYSSKFNAFKLERPDFLVQGSYQARYISNNGDIYSSDYILSKVGGKEYKIPGLYKADNNTLNCLNNEVEKGSDNDLALSLCSKKFSRFLEFSPSGYYLSYEYSGWESRGFEMVDVKTGKKVLSIEMPNFYSWTKDKKQFVYGGEAGMGTDRGLYITIKNSFPSKKLILDEDILSGYLDDSNIYVYTWKFDEIIGKGDYYRKVIEIKSGKVIYSEMIK